MNTSNDSLTSLQHRLEKLERQNRLMRRLAFAAMVLILVAVVSGQARRESREVAAEAYRLLDAEGKTRGELVMAEDGPLLRLLDPEGQPRATLSGGNQTALVLYDAEGHARVSTAAVESESGLSIFDDQGRPQAKVAVAGGRPALDLFEDGKRRVAVGVAKGDAAAALLSEEGHPQAMMSVGRDAAGKDTAAYALRDPNGNAQFVVTARKEGTLLSLFDVNENKSVSRLTITANEVGTGYFIKDGEGKLRMQLQMSDGEPQFSLFDENGNSLFSKP